jgi:hypothetical protein
MRRGEYAAPQALTFALPGIFIKEDRALWRSHTDEQGKWQRVRRELRRMKLAEERG